MGVVLGFYRGILAFVLGLYRGYSGIVESEMETSISEFKVWGLGFSG